MEFNFKQNKGDYILSFTAVVQSLLVVFQQCLISVLHMPEESTTIYRVYMSALPVIISLYYILRRKGILLVITYTTVIAVLFVHRLLFPKNEPYIIQSSTRFLLPILLPVFLSVISIRKFDIFINTLYYVSWFTFGLTLVYVVSLLTGNVVFDTYNMRFSYGLLIPTLSLYNKKNKLSLIAAFLLLLIIVAVGSRGPVLLIVLYLIYDITANNRKFLFPLLILGIVLYLSIPLFINFLEHVGVMSRTLSLLQSGEINNVSGRDYYYQLTIHQLMESPSFGLGLFGDRVYLNGAYCHNFLLELAIDFGIPIAFIICLCLLIWVIVRYYHFEPSKRPILMLFVVVAFKLLASGSYLEDYDLALLIGLLYRGDKDWF